MGIGNAGTTGNFICQFGFTADFYRGPVILRARSNARLVYVRGRQNVVRLFVASAQRNGVRKRLAVIKEFTYVVRKSYVRLRALLVIDHLPPYPVNAIDTWAKAQI